MKPKLFNIVLYNKLLEENKLLGVAYYPSKKGGFQFLLIVKSGLKVDFIKYNFIPYNKLFDMNDKDNLNSNIRTIISNFNKIYIPVKNIKGYLYEETEYGFNTYLKIKEKDKIITKFINKINSKNIDESTNLITLKDVLEDEGFVDINEDIDNENNISFKTLLLGVNQSTKKIFYI